jgi:arylsulfatase A-like enzyme
MNKPNIIYIYADDLGRGMLSCYGQKHFQTPNIDRIATEGLAFNNSYGCAFCAPSRASLLTGMHDCHRGGWTITQGGVYDKLTRGHLTETQISELIHTVSLNPADDEVFLPQIAKDAGYVTAEIGKLEWGFSTTDRDIRRHGWDYHYGYYDHAQCHGFHPPFLFENGERVNIPGNTREDFGVAPRVESEENRAERWDTTGRAVYSQDLFDEKILQFLRDNRNNSFFLYHPSQLPHGPIIIPEIDPAVKDNPDLTQYEKEYASMVLRLDRTVGLILDELDRLGIAEKTAVVFVSDNGHQPYYVQPGRCEPDRNLQTGETYDNVTTKFYSDLSGDIFDGNDGMAGKKFSNWEGGVRLPFLVRWPGVIEAGRRSDLLIANYDFLPTLAEMLNVPAPEGKDGVSFLAELMGDTERQREPGNCHDHVVFASRTGPALVTRDGWKLKQVTQAGQNLYQLYHLAEDYREENDIKYDAPEKVKELDPILLRECDGNFYNGNAASTQVWLPGLNFHGPDCHWDICWD